MFSEKVRKSRDKPFFLQLALYTIILDIPLYILRSIKLKFQNHIGCYPGNLFVLENSADQNEFRHIYNLFYIP